MNGLLWTIAAHTLPFWPVIFIFSLILSIRCIVKDSYYYLVWAGVAALCFLLLVFYFA